MRHHCTMRSTAPEGTMTHQIQLLNTQIFNKQMSLLHLYKWMTMDAVSNAVQQLFQGKRQIIFIVSINPKEPQHNQQYAGVLKEKNTDRLHTNNLIILLYSSNSQNTFFYAANVLTAEITVFCGNKKTIPRI